MSNKQKRFFQLSDEKVSQILFCDESDTEDALILDQEDLSFLKNDIEVLEESPLEQIEVTIEPPENFAADTKECSVEESCNSTHNETVFHWKKISVSKQKSIAAKYKLKEYNSAQFGNILLNFDGKEITPYLVFEVLTKFEDFLTKIVIPQTMLYSQQKGHVFNTTVNEMKAFFGMQIVMGYHKLPCIRDYWSSDPDLNVSYIANIMPLKRFEELHAYVHFNDNSTVKPKSDPEYDRAYKVRPVLHHFNECFLKAMSPTMYQSIDEHMIKFKGHNILRQYVKGKPVQWGFKLWCRCDAVTGYLFQFDLYTGKKVGYTEHGLGEGVVLLLTEQLAHKNCHIFIDNFFNSPQLQYNLLEKGILCAGTVRSNRKKLPKSNQLPEEKNMKRGEMLCFESERVFFTKWIDNKAVNMLSNYVATYPVTSIQRKSKGTDKKAEIDCPAVVKQYNKFMGGVDLMDQKKVTYQFDHRSKYKYYLRIVNDLLDISINNAEIVYNKISNKEEQLDSKTYRRIIARSLIGNYTNRKRQAPQSTIKHGPKPPKYLKACKSAGPHTMIKVEKRQRCKLCTSKKLQNRTNNMCLQCKIYLCYVNNRNCFSAYHAK